MYKNKIENKTNITYYISVKTFNVNWLQDFKNSLQLPMEIKKFSIVRSVITSKSAKDQYEIRCFVNIFFKNLDKYSKVLSPELLDRVLIAGIQTNKYNIKVIKVEKKLKF